MEVWEVTGQFRRCHRSRPFALAAKSGLSTGMASRRFGIDTWQGELHGDGPQTGSASFWAAVDNPTLRLQGTQIQQDRVSILGSVVRILCRYLMSEYLDPWG